MNRAKNVINSVYTKVLDNWTCLKVLNSKANQSIAIQPQLEQKNKTDFRCALRPPTHPGAKGPQVLLYVLIQVGQTD